MAFQKFGAPEKVEPVIGQEDEFEKDVVDEEDEDAAGGEQPVREVDGGQHVGVRARPYGTGK